MGWLTQPLDVSEALQVRLADRRDHEAWAVFADRLLDLGDPRGALVQERLAAARAGHRGYDKARREAFKREWFEAFVRETGPLPRKVRVASRFGFVLGVRAQGEALQRRKGAYDLRTWWPKVEASASGFLCRALELRSSPPWLDHDHVPPLMEDRRVFRRLHRLVLDLSLRQADRHFGLLAEGAFPFLRELAIGWCIGTQADLGAWLDSPLPRSLRGLRTGFRGTATDGLQAILACSHLERLDYLSDDPRLLVRLAGADFAPGLQRLSLWGPVEGSVRELPETPWPSLRELELRRDVTDDDLAALARRRFPRLERLDLRGNPLGDRGVAALARAEWPTLRWLYLDDERVGPEGIEALIRSSTLAGLRKIVALRSQWASRRALQALADRVRPGLHVAWR
ncbi:MAG: hypothetical protein AAF602_18090 [Myxococcota bacterium]